MNMLASVRRVNGGLLSSAVRSLHRGGAVSARSTACGCPSHSSMAATGQSVSKPVILPVQVPVAVPGFGAPGQHQHRAISSESPHDVAETPDITEIFQNNKKWVAAMQEQDPDYFKKLGATHKPEYLWIGCSDARVPANEIMGLGAGEVFVHRNVANMVVNTDMNMNAMLQYAVQYLEVKHIIVAGHYDCGGVKASMEKQDLGLVENWLGGVRDVYRLHQKELDAISDKDARCRRLVELNVIEQCLNVFQTGVVQRQRLKTFHERDNTGATFATPRIHAMVFDPSDGVLRKLKVNFKELIQNYRHIYDIYDAAAWEKSGV